MKSIVLHLKFLYLCIVKLKKQRDGALRVEIVSLKSRNCAN